MALYFKDTEITNIDNLVPQTGLDITDMWFGTTNVYTVWAVYEGTLPTTINANGSDLRQYQIYGNIGGVGDNTVNEFDKLTVEQYLKTSISSPTNWYASNSGNVLRFPCRPNTTYTIKIFNSVPRITLFRIAITDSENIPDKNNVPITRIINETSLQSVTTFQTDANTKFILLQVNNVADIIDEVIGSLTLTEGTTPHENYVPYGYEVDISTSDGTNATVTTIYIGSDPLGKDEYVDYHAGKVYRMINGVPTPTDPPVALPALPTCEGTTIVDYMGESQATPEKVLLKYRKEGF